jgi:hypothetical protein
VDVILYGIRKWHLALGRPRPFNRTDSENVKKGEINNERQVGVITGGQGDAKHSNRAMGRGTPTLGGHIPGTCSCSGWGAAQRSHTLQTKGGWGRPSSRARRPRSPRLR